MIHISDSMMIIRQSTNILTIITRRIGKLKTYISRIKIFERIQLILGTHSTKYVSMMTIMRKWNVSRNEYDLVAIMHGTQSFTHRWASYQIRKIAGCACAGNAGNVSPRRRFQRKPVVSDPGMHHGTCVTHVPWCMSGSLTCGDGENVPGIPGACAPAISRIWQEAHCTVVMETKPQRSRDLYKVVDRIWWYSHLRHTAIEKCDNNGKSWCILFDDENKMICKYIFPITLAQTGQFRRNWAWKRSC